MQLPETIQQQDRNVNDLTVGTCSVALTQRAGAIELVVQGLLDVDSIPSFTAQVDQVMCAEFNALHIDLNAADMDDTAIEAVAGLAEYVRARGRVCTISHRSGCLTGRWDRFEVARQNAAATTLASVNALTAA